ncbi:HlyD family type I secretion periplasmic adaptor subunit [Halomonas denitrificans]|uniref:HlyD family type I secretion periplasmic adaptor subunit n=1 Tax=Halomonas TaxID=2745 RepID=UPI001C984A47|nr:MULTISPECIES: HlyD family type I secretion periplasmic adaptor subunit [Halomonas]MBY5927714.1 HlyD family type I secretion periplasmic adaptor subunit [Halomonas sp. DP8Y7-3]MBY6029624.1 HlyD family type I secretion periplasmic adaptor subunit [Halomonas sp. DP8Y7-1]MBY6207096.1 HlyD family type I secretion periplasmic adaptor subunit [Halomonas sp. DP3Y7-2]MBY6229690.1 HlyD family type I secretion periplasmic adaptor subunit [Halomonas sp. DP3Y7-1]MCA0917978.1 HlyD family type I secretion
MSAKSAEQKGFEGVGRVSRSGGKVFRPFIDRLFARRVSASHLNRDWASDADWARMQQDPLRARLMLYMVVVAIICVVVWACFAPIDEVTRGSGRVIPSSQLQRVQSFDGGVVQEIQVAEGDFVEAGDLLMRIDPTRFLSNFNENRAKAETLQAKAERLRALATGSSFDPSEELIEQAPNIVSRERELYQSSLETLDEQKQILQQRLEQRRAELNEAAARRNAASRELNLASQELNMTRPLLSSGAVSEVEVLRLQREVSRASGERNQAAAQVSRLEAAIVEAQGELREVDAKARTEWRQELSATLGELSALNESSEGLQDRVRLSEIRSPVDGVVQRLAINTIGGVAQPGQEVVDIVPTDDALVVEAKIAPQDIAFLRPGLPATIKLTAYDFSIYGGLDAELEHISADTTTDEEGNTYYRVRVRTQDEEAASEVEVIPGMTAQVDILTGKRTVMQFLLKPVLRAWGNAMGER